MKKHLLITGGNGFLGKQICLLAADQGFPTVSIARSGKPKGIKKGEYENITWVAADIFESGTWEAYLENCRAVIHCIGIIEEQPDKGITYEKMILRSAAIVGVAAKSYGVPKFIYISAGAGAPDTPAAYMDNKIATENLLRTLVPHLTILKPSLLFGDEKPETIRENESIQQWLADPHIGLKIYPNRPLPVRSVAAVALYAAITEGMDEKLSVDDIEKLAATIKPA